MDDPAKILIVEDDKVIRTVLEMSLHGAGFRHFESVGRGDDALRLAAATKPDLVLLDLMLPGLDGLAVARRIREIGQLADTGRLDDHAVRMILIDDLLQRIAEITDQ